MERGSRLSVGWKILLYLGLVIATLGILEMLGLAGGGRLQSAGALLLAALLAGGVLLLMEGHPLSALGFGLHAGVGRELGGGTLLGLLLLAPVFAILVWTGTLEWLLRPGEATTWIFRAATSLFLLGVAAASEEVLLRGYPFQALTRAWGEIPALLSTSVLFGVVHLGNPGSGWLSSTGVTAAGLFLGVLVLRTGSLWWATGVHLGWNWGQAFLADLRVSGLDIVDTPFWDGRLDGAPWLAGGGFGVEGSVLTTLVMTAAAVWAWRTPVLRPRTRRWWKHEDREEPDGESGGHDTIKESTA